VRNAQLETHDTFVRGHPDGSPFNDTPITLLIDLQIRSTCVKTLSKKKKIGLLKKREKLAHASQNSPVVMMYSNRPSQVLSHQCIHQSTRNANRKDAVFRKRRRTRPENSHHPICPRYKISLVLLYLVLLLLLLLLLLRRRSSRRRRRIQRRERYLCPSRCDLETCDFLRARP